MTTPIEEKIHVENGLPVHFLSHLDRINGTALTDAHYHDYIEIIYSLEGTHVAQISGESYTFSAGDLVLINPGCVHSFIYEKGRYLCLQFDPETIFNSHKNAVGLKYILPFIMNGFENTAIIRKADLDGSRIPGILMEIHRECCEKTFGYEFAIQVMLNEIYLWLLRFWHSRNSEMNFSNNVAEQHAAWLQKVFSHVAENYRRPITSLEMSRLCNLSYSYFSRVFKKITKKAFRNILPM